MLIDIDSKNNNEYIIEDLDEEHILVKETKVTRKFGKEAVYNVNNSTEDAEELPKLLTVNMLLAMSKQAII